MFVEGKLGEFVCWFFLEGLKASKNLQVRASALPLL